MGIQIYGIVRSNPIKVRLNDIPIKVRLNDIPIIVYRQKWQEKYTDSMPSILNKGYKSADEVFAYIVKKIDRLWSGYDKPQYFTYIPHSNIDYWLRKEGGFPVYKIGPTDCLVWLDCDRNGREIGKLTKKNNRWVLIPSPSTEADIFRSGQGRSMRLNLEIQLSDPDLEGIDR